jgi:hypothetical protein
MKAADKDEFVLLWRGFGCLKGFFWQGIAPPRRTNA